MDEWEDLTPEERRHIGWQRFMKCPDDVYLCPRCMPPGAVYPDDFDSYDEWLPDPHCKFCFGFGVVSDITEIIREAGEEEEAPAQQPEDNDEAEGLA
ncbi:MAG: hypothetical protein JRD89_00235 [Deltaproteobacteria bacterium]|nr:hypothetical protein [Deltaproteobacteria bacterium]